MCLAIPMKVVDVNGNMGTVEAFGVRRAADLVMVQPVEVGSYVLVHAGFALQVMDEASALETLGYFEQMALLGESEMEAEEGIHRPGQMGAPPALHADGPSDGCTTGGPSDASKATGPDGRKGGRVPGEESGVL